MWIVALALRRPVTIIAMAALMMLFGLYSFFSMSKDIFPAVNLPEVNLVWYYPGMSAPEIEKRIVNITERATSQTVTGVDHIESNSFSGIGVVKIYFQENASTALAIAQLSSVTSAIRNILPQGIAPPTILNFNATNVPIIDVISTSETLSEMQLYDYMFNFVGLFLFTLPGVQSPAPFGGATRQVMLNLDPGRLYAKGVSPQDVLNTLETSNVILPGGTAKFGNYEYVVTLNGSPIKVDEFNHIPIKYQNNATVFVGDVAPASDSYAVQTDIARVNGVRASFRYVLKLASASTLDVVNDVKGVIPRINALAPKGTKIYLAFDQSLFVKDSLIDVFQEIFIASVLVGIMTIVFLGSWRSTLIVITSIPLAIMTSIAALHVTGQTINIMTLGGLALSVGMLVDDATVEVENIHRNHAMGKPLAVAILDGAHQIAMPALVGTLCICIVFAPVAMLKGVSKFLFTPLAMAVIFAMLTSYLLSRTLVATMAINLLPEDPNEHGIGGRVGEYLERFDQAFERFKGRYKSGLTTALEHRGLVLGCIAVVILSSMLLLFAVGQDFFPYVDAGQIKLHVRVPAGTRLEETERMMAKVENIVRSTIPSDELQLMTDHIGLPVYWALLFYQTDTIGPQDADLQIELSEKHHPSLGYIKKIRQAVNEQMPGVQIYSQAADITSQVLNFGLSAPIDVQFQGRDAYSSYKLAVELLPKIKVIPGAVDVRIPETFDYPTLRVNIDRAKALQLGISENLAAQNLLNSLASSVVVAPNNWLDWDTGVNYSVAVQTPQHVVNSFDEVLKTPVNGLVSSTSNSDSTTTGSSNAQTQFVSNIASIEHTVTPLGIAHMNVLPVIDLNCGVEGRDLGGVAADVQKAIATLKDIPPGTTVQIRGQSQAMREAFGGMGSGLILAMVLVYLLMAINFQSWLDPLLIMMALPGALAGVLWMLVIWHTTLNVQSLMGAIMSVGVATTNGNLLITFANEYMEKENVDPMTAAIEAGTTRLRPVLMTALAMILGMLPMSLALGAGGGENAPLGRAVIGGLIAATFMTLLVIPIVYSFVGGTRISKLQRDAQMRRTWALTEAAKEAQM
ncbi:efflux RND transporter permease subunit [Candidatus Binatus sp.]|uniref:efflux RND transporter permease subunit n=3 Tax=Candidatus Binatus sp. TaxID=2811406 RepID=UPI003C32B1F6